jgi:hypothetical protein
MLDPAQIAAIATKASLGAVSEAHAAFREMFLRGFGVTFFALGFVTGAAAVGLRIAFEDQMSTAVFFGVLAGSLLLIAMSFVFFLFDLRSSERTIKAATAQSEAVTNALIEQQRQLMARIAQLEEAKSTAGVR